MYTFNAHKPLCSQLYNQIKEDIIKGKLKANEKMPSLRALAGDYKLSKTTVLNAYSQLCIEGYVYSMEKRGYFVSEDLYKPKVVAKKAPSTQEKISYKYDFFGANLDSGDFPKKTWQRLYNKALNQNLEFGRYQDTQGLKSLRNELANYLQNSRGLSCKAEQIVLCSGFSDALFITLRLLKNHTKSIACEEKTYRVATKIFKEFGFGLDELPLSSNGISLEVLEKSKAKLLYLTPAHGYFNGSSTPIAKKIKLIEWAKKTKSFIIEDDYDSELSYYNKPIPAMQGINNNDQVIYFGTLSKSFSPALRIAYLVLPVCLLKKYKKCFDYPFSGISLCNQKTLELFIKEGYFARHIRKIRTKNKKLHNLLKSYLLEKIGDEIEIIKQGCGLNIIIKPTVMMDIKKFELFCKTNEVKIYTRFDKYISLGFGGFSEDELKEAVEKFVNIWQNFKG